MDRSSILVFEGPDAAGKGGVIRRIIPTLDARNYRVLQYGAPTDEERAHHYLWRFWRHLARSGRLTIFDRSWYGRVLVERVERLASDDEWRRAYAEINDFEDQLIEHGTILIKFWLHVTPDEQWARFRDRKKKAYKRWKLTAEDWRNRSKWYAYEEAAHDMVKYTSTHISPWELVSANDKNYARVKVLEKFGDLLEKALEES
jgi:polyphosphate kinase 2 (PPK2 family)